MNLTIKRPFSKSQTRTKALFEDEKSVIALKTKQHATTGTIVIQNLLTPFFVSHPITRAAAQGDSPKLKVRTPPFPSIAPFDDVLTCVLPQTRRERSASFSVIQREVAMTDDDVTPFFLFTLLWSLLLSFPLERNVK